MNLEESAQTFALLVLEHISSKYSPLALFQFNRVSVVVSVESTDLLGCSSYKVRFTQLCCGPGSGDDITQRLIWYRPSGGNPEASRTPPHTSGCTGLNETQTGSWGLRVQILKEERLAD